MEALIIESISRHKKAYPLLATTNIILMVCAECQAYYDDVMYIYLRG